MRKGSVTNKANGSRNFEVCLRKLLNEVIRSYHDWKKLRDEIAADKTDIKAEAAVLLKGMVDDKLEILRPLYDDGSLDDLHYLIEDKETYYTLLGALDEKYGASSKLGEYPITRLNGLGRQAL